MISFWANDFLNYSVFSTLANYMVHFTAWFVFVASIYQELQNCVGKKNKKTIQLLTINPMAWWIIPRLPANGSPAAVEDSRGTGAGLLAGVVLHAASTLFSLDC